jgi:hypothetical protein
MRDPATAYDAVLENVLKHEADRLLRSGYAPTSKISTEVLERRQSGHEPFHLADSHEHG